MLALLLSAPAVATRAVECGSSPSGKDCFACDAGDGSSSIPGDCVACKNGKYAVVKLLAKAGADISNEAFQLLLSQGREKDAEEVGEILAKEFSSVSQIRDLRWHEWLKSHPAFELRQKSAALSSEIAKEICLAGARDKGSLKITAYPTLFKVENPDDGTGDPSRYLLMALALAAAGQVTVSTPYIFFSSFTLSARDRYGVGRRGV